MKLRVYTSLQYARGIAAMFVVYYHAVLASVNAFAGWDSALPWVGASGVDLFFVLSGFVMWTSTAGKPMTAVEFYRRRVVRIVPLYWAATSALLVLALAVPRLAQTTAVEPMHVLASYLFVPWPNPGMVGRPPADLMTPLLVPGWTLNYEMFFYLLFGLVLMLREEWRFRALIVGLPLVMIACMAGSEHSRLLNFYGTMRLLEFAAGVVLARVALADRSGLPAPMLGLVALGLVAMPVIEAARLTWSTVYIGAAAVVTVWGLVEWEQRGKVPMIRTLRLLGDASFSIYLTHIFAIAALRVVAMRTLAMAEFAERGLAQLTFVTVAMIVSALVGIVVHLLFEQPVTRFLARKGAQPAAVAGDPVPVAALKH